MAQNTKTWDALTGLVQSRLGHDLSDKDLARVGYLANSAATMLYDETPWWERFLVLEPRTVLRGYVDYTEDSYNVYGAGTEEANGLYTRNGSFDGKPSYTKAPWIDLSFEEQMLTPSLFWNVDRWEISTGETPPTQTIYYENLEDTAIPPSGGWAVVSGEEPAPLLTALADIDTYMLISGTDSIRDSSSRPIRFYVDSSGANLRSNSDSDVVWVTYKKVNSDIYGDGNSGTTAAIPSEWFNYMTLYAAYMYQSSQRQNNPNSGYGLALREVENALQDELIRLEDQHITDNLAKNVYTHASQNNSLS